MAKRERISVAVGEFTKSDGSKGTDWMNIGTLITKDDGKKFMELIPYINFTSLPRKDGKLYAQVFEVQQRDGPHAGSVNTGTPKPASKSAPFDDEIPF